MPGLSQTHGGRNGAMRSTLRKLEDRPIQVRRKRDNVRQIADRLKKHSDGVPRGGVDTVYNYAKIYLKVKGAIGS